MADPFLLSVVRSRPLLEVLIGTDNACLKYLLSSGALSSVLSLSGTVVKKLLYIYLFIAILYCHLNLLAEFVRNNN